MHAYLVVRDRLLPWFLTKMSRETAEAYLGYTVTNAAASVPACFNHFAKWAVWKVRAVVEIEG